MGRKLVAGTSENRLQPSLVSEGLHVVPEHTAVRPIAILLRVLAGQLRDLSGVEEVRASLSPVPRHRLTGPG